jgi:hypothetical protein
MVVHSAMASNNTFLGPCGESRAAIVRSGRPQEIIITEVGNGVNFYN